MNLMSLVDVLDVYDVSVLRKEVIDGSVCPIRSSHPACEGRHLHGRGGDEEGDPQRAGGPHRRPIAGRRQQDLQADAE